MEKMTLLMKTKKEYTRIATHTLAEMKNGVKIAMLTAYDYSFQSY